MKNGDSFHNGSENIELQRRIREGAGLQSQPEDPAEQTEPASAPAKPTKNIYANGATGQQTAPPSTEGQPTPATKSGYTRPKGNIYANGGSYVIAKGTPAHNPYADPRIEDHTPPHQRPYVSIYAQKGGVTYTAGAEKPSAKNPEAPRPMEERNYTAVYARRVANRTETSERGSYSNTPDMTEGIPYYADTELPPSGSSSASHGPATGGYTPPAYGTSSAKRPASAYSSEDYADEDAERAHKKRYNITALILGIASFAGNMVCLTCLTPITAILAIIFGCVGRIGGKFEQKGLTGFVLGIAYCGILVLGFLFLLMVGLLTADGTGAPLE